MIKQINHQNFLTTPFVAPKTWHFYNIESDDLVVIEDTGSVYAIALEYTDYSTDSPFLNRDCNIALEQQSNDRVVFQEGITGSGAFYPDSEPINQDKTYKRLVHAQTKATFYNKYRNPVQIFGVEYIDFPIGKTYRYISDIIRIFSIPQEIFGDRIIENSVNLSNIGLDDNIVIVDDGYQNLVASSNLFSRIQEVRKFGNILSDGSASFECYANHIDSHVHDPSNLSVGFSMGQYGGAGGQDTISIGVGFSFGSVTDLPSVDNSILSIGAGSGSYTLEVIQSFASESGSISTTFMSGSLFLDTIISSGSVESGSNQTTFLNGSMLTEVITSSLSGVYAESSSISTTFITGSMYTEVYGSTGQDNSYMTVGFLNGSRS